MAQEKQFCLVFPSSTKRWEVPLKPLAELANQVPLVLQKSVGWLSKVVRSLSNSAKRNGGEVRVALYPREGYKPDGYDQTPDDQNYSLRLHEFATAIGCTIGAEFTDRDVRRV
jgi:hypothetical protein